MRRILAARLHSCNLYARETLPLSPSALDGYYSGKSPERDGYPTSSRGWRNGLVGGRGRGSCAGLRGGLECSYCRHREKRVACAEYPLFGGCG